ncbi:endolytic transglycosylase MltG [Kangiella aquimarina]|uniref:Endolytic murein transglycosylase n=1 Tax=Kangiella aquimarina TaxID=261965 RepID=A0ABZ0X1T4_9GAMM|nr:endolytic transglycosylase MltG [Kangiella aquimarina]WQG84523.1 endolytic transglycosylase MltG [Kangiella aquimarina]
MKKPILTFFILLVLIFSGITWYLWNGFQEFIQQPLGLEQELDVEKGTSAYSLGRKWQKQDVIEQFYYYQLLLKLKPELRSIKAGNYKITPDMTAVDVLQKLVAGDVIKYQFSVIEGSNIYELLVALQANPDLVHELNYEKEYADIFRSMQFVGQSHPEGMFYADTYQFIKGDSDLDILKRAHDRLLTILDQEWSGRADGLPYETPYQALIMASIIEKETAVPAERPEISGVFVRRMAKNMLLQTDPTIIYGLLPEFDGNIRRNDIRNPHPWNTYVHRGLPPTPIAMVGREAIQAALNPKPGDTLYFVAKGDGSHHFSKTLEEHNRAVRKYQLNR